MRQGEGNYPVENSGGLRKDSRGRYIVEFRHGTNSMEELDSETGVVPPESTGVGQREQVSCSLRTVRQTSLTHQIVPTEKTL